MPMQDIWGFPDPLVKTRDHPEFPLKMARSAFSLSSCGRRERRPKNKSFLKAQAGKVKRGAWSSREKPLSFTLTPLMTVRGEGKEALGPRGFGLGVNGTRSAPWEI